jgi:hypothetical protein
MGSHVLDGAKNRVARWVEGQCADKEYPVGFIGLRLTGNRRQSDPLRKRQNVSQVWLTKNEIDSHLRVEKSRVEHRYGNVLRLDNQREFGAPQNNALCSALL